MGNRAVVQTVALIFGVIYFLVGVLGFIGPLIGTSSFITITQDRHALLGLADINLLHNLVHLAIGLAGLAAASSVANSRTFCQVVGVILLIVGLLGVFVGNLFGILPLAGFDIPLHLVTGAVLAYFGFAATISVRSRA
ncbi:MAG: DUF4383 domain-containing protein [Chloroflexi bacterium]|nr:MAG: DUF4383 domain-containing protein [Chloroflexota bacterium]